MIRIKHSENELIRQDKDDELTTLAENGNAEAMYELYLKLNDTRSANRWLRKACELGNGQAQYAMGIRYITGDGIKWSITTAIEWMRKSSENGYPEAEDFIQKYGMIADYIKDAELGNSKAQGEMASALLDLALECKNSPSWLHYVRSGREAVRWALEAIKDDDANACGVLGYFSYYGNVIKCDRDKAIQYYEKGAQQEEKRCLHGLGIQYLWGKHIDRDLHKGFMMIEKAAKQGYPPAMYDLARCYRYALGTPGNLAKAVQWYTKSEMGGIGRSYNDPAELKLFEKLCPGAYYEDCPEREPNNDQKKTRFSFNDDIILNLSYLTLKEEQDAEKVLLKDGKYDGLVEICGSSEIPDGFVNAMAPSGEMWWNDAKVCSLSGLRVFCDNNKKEAIAYFRESFESRWWRWVKYINTFYINGRYDISKGSPVTVVETDYGFFVSVSVLRPKEWGWVDITDIRKFAEPLGLAFCDMIRKYHVQMIDGTVNFSSSDGKWSANDSFSLLYNTDFKTEKEYEFVGEALCDCDIAESIGSYYREGYFEASYPNMTEVIDFLIHYSKWIPGEQMEKLFSTVSNPDWLKEHYFDDCIDKVIEYVRYARECYLRGEQPKHEEPVKETEDYF